MGKEKELVGPSVVGQDEVILKHFSRLIVKRHFQYPHGIEDWVLWGAASRRAPAIIFPLTKDGKVVALRQFRHAPTPPRFIIELPGGNPISMEKSEEVAKQELIEETGFTAEKFQVIGSPETWFDPASCFTPFVPTLATGCEKVGEPKPDKTEIFETVLFTVPEWINMIYSGEVCDSKSITLTFLALPHIGMKLTLNSIPLF